MASPPYLATAAKTDAAAAKTPAATRRDDATLCSPLPSLQSDPVTPLATRDDPARTPMTAWIATSKLNIVDKGHATRSIELVRLIALILVARCTVVMVPDSSSRPTRTLWSFAAIAAAGCCCSGPLP